MAENGHLLHLRAAPYLFRLQHHAPANIHANANRIKSLVNIDNVSLTVGRCSQCSNKQQ